MRESFKPTAAMRRAAELGLELRREHGRGGTAVGVARARDIVSGKSLPLATVGRMYSFFSRHRKDLEAKNFSDDPDDPSNGWIAWLLWGGDPGDRWSSNIWESRR